MGGKTGEYGRFEREGYVPQVLPYLRGIITKKNEEYSSFFWTSTTETWDESTAYLFLGKDGFSNRFQITREEMFRCIVPPPAKDSK